MNATLITADLAVLHEPDGRHWVYLRRPLEWTPAPDDAEVLNLPPLASEGFLDVLRHVEQRRRDRSMTREDHQASYDAPYALLFNADGTLDGIYEGVGTTWENMIAHL
jgi:hypothetical protein